MHINSARLHGFLFLLYVFVAYISQSVWGYTPIHAAIVADAETGEILYSHNAYCKTQPASLTKILSLFVAFKYLKLRKIRPRTMMRVSKYAEAQHPSSLKLKAGNYISCRNAILAMITKSANDASVVLAEHIAGTEKNFTRIMNREAQKCGMTSSFFVNASGWKNNKQVTTAADMLKLSLILLKKYPEFFKLFSTKKFVYKGKSYYNHNKLLGERGGIKIDGIKTGFVAASGFNIVASAVKRKRRLIVIVLGGKTAQRRNAEVEWLLSCAFNKLEKRKADKSCKRSSIASAIKGKRLLLKMKPRHNNV